MRISRLLPVCLILISVSAAGPAHAEPGAAPAYALPNTEVIGMTAEANGVDYQLYVKLPAGYAADGKNYPVMVTLDADYQFALTATHAEHLWQRGQAPEMIIVSIAYAYDPADRMAYRINRTRDYTPAHTEEGGYGPDVQKHSGGGPAFAAFIGEELLPFLDARYRTDPSERFYVGHSYGGLFGAWLLLTHPDYFNRYILVSPSIWFNDKMLLSPEETPAEPLSRTTQVYMGVGSWEEQPERSYAMVSDLKAFAARLDGLNDDNLVMEMRVYDDETHASIFPAVFSTGLRHHFETMDD